LGFIYFRSTTAAKSGNNKPGRKDVDASSHEIIRVVLLLSLESRRLTSRHVDQAHRKTLAKTWKRTNAFLNSHGLLSSSWQRAPLSEFDLGGEQHHWHPSRRHTTAPTVTGGVRGGSPQ